MLHMWYLWCGRLYLGGIGGILCKTQLLNIRGKWFRIGGMKRLFITWMDLVEISGVIVIEQFHSLPTFFSQYLICSVRERPPRKLSEKASCRISETAISWFQIGEMQDHVLYMYAMYLHAFTEYQEWLSSNIRSGLHWISGVVVVDRFRVCRHSSLWTSRTAHSGHIPRSLELQRQLLKCQQQEWKTSLLCLRVDFAELFHRMKKSIPPFRNSIWLCIICLTL